MGTTTSRKDIKAFPIILLHFKQIIRFSLSSLSVSISVNSSIYCFIDDVSSGINSCVKSCHNDSLSESYRKVYNLPCNTSYSSQDSLIFSEIKILSLNAGGLKKRLTYTHLNWEETDISYDIVCIQETNFDPYDLLDVLGFKNLPLDDS